MDCSRAVGMDNVSSSDVRTELRGFISEELLGAHRAAPIADQEDLLRNGLDSLGILRLTVFVEDRFGISIPDELVVPDNVRTLDALVALIDSLS